MSDTNDIAYRTLVGVLETIEPRATQACETLPPESAKTLVARCRGARLFMEARQIPLALTALDDVEKLMAGVDDKQTKAAFLGLVKEIRRAVQWSEGSRS